MFGLRLGTLFLGCVLCIIAATLERRCPLVFFPSNAQGERFNEFKKDNFYQIQWRPRPASLLSSEEKKKIIKNLRKVPSVIRLAAVYCTCRPFLTDFACFLYMEACGEFCP